MKKIMIFVAACVALASCTKDIDTTTSKTGDVNAFEKGQQVTLSLSAGEQTKVSSELVTSGTDKDKVNFKWETGDKIKITVGTESAEFTLKSGAGTSTATFEGTMPAAGNTFDAQYPVTEPDLTSQDYVANGLPKDKMKMTATNCTIAEGFTLTPQYSALRLNLWGVHTISKIVVTAGSSYTLDCGAGVAVGTTAETATPFFIVVPAGIYKFSVDVFNDAQTPVSIGNFETNDALTFTAGKILNMPAKQVASSTPTIAAIEISGTKYVGDKLTFTAIVDGFSSEPAIDYFIKEGDGEYELLDENSYTPVSTGIYYIKAYAAYDSEENEKAVQFIVTEKPVDVN